MQEKPRVGLILMRANWTGSESTKDVLDTIQADTQSMVNRLGRYFDVLGPWVVDSQQTLHACQHALRDMDMDMVLLAYQTFAEDIHLVSLLQAIGTRPLVMWCYVPWRRFPRPASFGEVLRGSGPVGAFGALGTLRNLDVPFLFTFGAPDDPRLIQDLATASRAARVRQQLRSARFGLMPSRNDRMQSTYVDEFRLMADFGPVVENISVAEYERMTRALDPDQVSEYRASLASQFVVQDVPADTLERAALTSMALAQVARERHLDVLAIDDVSLELKQAFNQRPALYPVQPDLEDVLFQPEADLGAATANYILHCLTGSPTMFLEFWSWDEAKNQLIGGHAGLQNPEVAVKDQLCISRDYDLCRAEGGAPSAQDGAQFQFIARPGRVTLFQLRSTSKGWQAIAASGFCLEDQPFIEGHPHAIIRLDAQIDHFLNRLAAVGATQHWVMAYGSVLNEIEAFCQMEKLPLELLSY